MFSYSHNRKRNCVIFLAISIIRESSVGIATGYALDGRGSFLSRGKRFSLLHSVQGASRGHPASYPMGIGGSLPGGKAVGGVKLTTHLHLVPR
jgi:hypothetical protein